MTPEATALLSSVGEALMALGRLDNALMPACSVDPVGLWGARGERIVSNARLAQDLDRRLRRVLVDFHDDFSRLCK